MTPLPHAKRARSKSAIAAKPRKSRTSTSDSSASATRWLLLIHQIPPKPDYLRVKIGRRLQRLGAVAIKNSVYVLPATADAYEDFQWIVREIEEGGGDAFVSEATLIGEGLTDDAVRARFDAARNEDYRTVLTGARALLKTVRRPTTGSPRQKASSNSATKPSTTRRAAEHELAKLRRRYEAVTRIDFFGASDRSASAMILSEIQQAIRDHGYETIGQRADAPLDGKTWVTRRDVHVDRIACAWLIRRFVDRRARFRFVDPKHYDSARGELRFDMFEAEYTHVGDACTFEILLMHFVPDDSGLRQIAEIVHDADCKDAKFGRDEAPGLARMISGIAALCPRDEDRLERGARLFEDLYAAFGGGRAT